MPGRDYEGHHAINELALVVAADFGGFTLTPAFKNRIAISRGRADRWRNMGDLPLNISTAGHYMDLEVLETLRPDAGDAAVMRTILSQSLRGNGWRIRTNSPH